MNHSHPKEPRKLSSRADMLFMWGFCFIYCNCLPTVITQRIKYRLLSLCLRKISDKINLWNCFSLESGLVLYQDWLSCFCFKLTLLMLFSLQLKNTFVIFSYSHTGSLVLPDSQRKDTLWSVILTSTVQFLWRGWCGEKKAKNIIHVMTMKRHAYI